MSDASDNTGPGRYVSLDLGLHFSHPLGCLRPYFEALEQGRALGVRCESCARTWFPPRRTCCGNSVAENWTELAGAGHFAAICDHGGGHTYPGEPDSVWQFFQDHPWGTVPSPYEGGLPAGFASSCSLSP